MPTPLRRRIRHTRRILGYGALIVLILLATLVGALNQLLPLVEQHPDRVAAWLSERAGQPVTFSRAVGEWTRRGPLFTLDDLRIGQGEQALDIGRAELLVAVYSGLLPGEPLTELKVHDLALVLEQGEDKRWKLVGLPFEPKPGVDPLDTLEGLGELQIERAQLTVRTPMLDREQKLARVDLRVRVDGPQLHAGVRVWATKDGSTLTAVADLQRENWSGGLWAGADDLRLEEWAPLLRAGGIVIAGRGDIDLWARIEAQRVVDVRSRAEFAPLAMVALAPWQEGADGRLQSPPVAWERAGLLARWQVDDNGWHLHVPELRFVEPGDDEPRRFDGLWLANGRRFAVIAPRLDLGPARALATLSDAVPTGLRRWLHEAAPDGELRDVHVAGGDGRWRGSARIAGAGWAAYASKPGLQGLSGAAAFDQDGGVLRLDGGRSRFEWSGFRQVLDVQLDGTLGWWRDGGQWTAGAAGLRIRGDDFGATARAEIHFPGDGTKPRLDLAATVDETQVPVAGKFWVVGKMPEATIEWLDHSLQAGTVADGRAVIAGDLDDWPFRGASGRFDARAHVRDATVDFHKDWPAAEDVDVDVAFDGPGMSLHDGAGTLLANRVQHFDGAIADFKDPVLTLDIATPAQGEPLQALLLASPLRARWEEHLLNASMRGQAQVGLQLYLPLAARLGANRIDGTLELQDAALADPRWGLSFAHVSGTTTFSERGFAAEALAVELDGFPATFDLRVGADYTNDAGLAAQAALRGTLPASVLIAMHEPLDWLRPWLDGASAWTVRVDIPQAPPGRPQPPARLHVESDLAGTTVTLPAPLAKPADVARTLLLDAPLPLRDGEIHLRHGDGLMTMRARSDAQGTMRGLIRFGGDADSVPTAPGFVVDGRAQTLDAAGWIAFAAGSDDAAPGTQVLPLPAADAGGMPPAATVAARPAGGSTAALRSVDLQVATLDLLGSPFADARIRLARQPDQTRVDVEGAAIAGTVEIPVHLSTGVRGRFQRLFWPEKPEPTDAERAAADAGESDDPGKLPPLDFVVEDLRSGNLQLGRTELVAAPIADGLRIDRFTTRSPTLQLLASGDWLRAGEGHSTSRFQVEFNASSLGELLAAFGLSGMVEEGETHGRLDGQWPGSPGGFSMARFEGTMKVEVGEGSLLEVEPGGGGRVLGLLSLAEIPRRLSLDFSDFFEKGFGFNTMSGEFVFADGRATTDLLQIDGPAAEIRVSGSTDLRREQYDQRIEVLPKTGGVLPAIGALAGGPVGAAVGAVAQAVLQRPLKEAARTVYRITGPWEEPVVEVIEKGPARENLEAEAGD